MSICLKMARMWKQDILSLFAKKDNRLSGNLSKLTSTQFSAFLFCGLKVRPLESGTKQCSFHVHGGQVKSKAFLEVEIIVCQFEGSSVVGICLVYLLHLLIDLDISAIICCFFISGFCLHSSLLVVLSFPVLMEAWQSWRTSWAAILREVWSGLCLQYARCCLLGIIVKTREILRMLQTWNVC